MNTVVKYIVYVLPATKVRIHSSMQEFGTWGLTWSVLQGTGRRVQHMNAFRCRKGIGLREFSITLVEDCVGRWIMVLFGCARG